MLVPIMWKVACIIWCEAWKSESVIACEFQEISNPPEAPEASTATEWHPARLLRGCFQEWYYYTLFPAWRRSGASPALSCFLSFWVSRGCWALLDSMKWASWFTISEGLVVLFQLSVSSWVYQDFPYCDSSLKICLSSTFFGVFRKVITIPLTTRLYAQLMLLVSPGNDDF